MQGFPAFFGYAVKGFMAGFQAGEMVAGYQLSKKLLEIKIIHNIVFQKKLGDLGIGQWDIQAMNIVEYR